jgi:hypothetical protein
MRVGSTRNTKAIKTKVVAQNGQSIETGNAGQTRQIIKTKQEQKKKPNTMWVGHHYPQSNTNNVNTI